MNQITYSEYVLFCRAFQQLNFFEFEEKNIQVQAGENPCYMYVATFRDESNYKTNVLIIFNGFAISWEIGDGWEDALAEISELYDTLMQMKESGLQLLL
ncbi:hypothetical protein ACTHSJ_32515 [Paenibacillus cellulositrophicus]|uniref:hypothetical protein n=1 Tax=Paenibacillus cellulositrophicus TaxID=562959 RepID=UPI003F7E50D0